MKRGRSVANLLLVLVAACWLTAAAVIPVRTVPSKRKVTFSRDVLPILSDKCFKCHGPDAGSRMADLRLDQAQSAFAQRDGAWAIVPGKPADSVLVQRITRHEMPPRSSGKSLSPEEIETLTEWIQQGAVYTKLWSFEALPKSVPIPAVPGNWAREPIDRFIRHRLAQEGLRPSPPATKDRLLRRVTLDLTGLPPTLEEINAFDRDESADAYEKVVDRLLASSHFGERVATDWLDAARYSDSYGYQADLLMPAWPYRDWVIKAFNENMPYNEFLIEQLAGDLLPHPTRDQILATEFNRLNRQSNEGGSIIQEMKATYAEDRAETFGTAVLGLTVMCAKCHDHKFDPITQREYYQLYAYFNSINEYGLYLSSEIVPTPSLLLPTPEQGVELGKLRANSVTADEALTSSETAAQSEFADWIRSHNDRAPAPLITAHFPLNGYPSGQFSNDLQSGDAKIKGNKIGDPTLGPGPNGKEALTFDGDNGLVLHGLPSKERWDAFTWSFWLKDAEKETGDVIVQHRTGGTDVGFCGFDLMLDHGYLSARVMRHWPGNAVAVRSNVPIAKGAWTNVAWSWDGSGRAAGLKIFLNGKQVATTVLADRLWKKIDAYPDLGGGGGDWTFAQRFRAAGFKGGAIADISFAPSDLSNIEIAQLYDGKALTEAWTHAGGTDQQKEYYVDEVNEGVQKAKAAIRASQRALTEYEDGILEVPVMADTPKPEPAYLLARGAYDAPKNDQTRVVRGVPKSLPPLNCVGVNNRLALARWAVRRDNPLTARVAVNRIWQMVFGTGLVETSENFGVQGSQPTHPELLDYLAVRFMDSGWNVKALIREMVLSSTYRQDSASSAKLNAVDPHNKLYARGPSNRLTAEMVRDTALAASGLLNPTLGGPPVNAYQPATIWTENNTMSPQFVQSVGTDLYRRSIYSTWKRTTPVPSMMLFDANSRETCMVRRPSTNTPMQALVLLNDVQYVEAARFLAEDVLRLPDDDAGRIKYAFRRLSGREPDPRELQILIATLQDQRTQFAGDRAASLKLIHVGASKPDPKLDPVQLAAMTEVIQTILNSDAVIWKR